jgi:hypothetical protein
MVQRKNLFQDNNFLKSYLPQIRGSSWHKNEITSKTQQKEEVLKRKHWVISQECFSLTPLS